MLYITYNLQSIITDIFFTKKWNRLTNGFKRNDSEPNSRLLLRSDNSPMQESSTGYIRRQYIFWKVENYTGKSCSTLNLP